MNQYERLREQNRQLEAQVQRIFFEIQHQKTTNNQHQTQIQTLLNFNERLLGIIDNQLNNKKDNQSLQPISERSERESDLAGAPMHSFIKSRRLQARSERGSPTTNSLVQRAHFIGKKKIDIFAGDIQKSELNHSMSIEQRSDYRRSVPGGHYIPQSIEVSTNIAKEMSKELNAIKVFKTGGTNFYDNKIKEIQSISQRLAQQDPVKHLGKITQKLAISPKTANLIRERLSGKTQ